MAIRSKKQKACVQRYRQRHYDQISLCAPKGFRAAIQAAADQRGISTAAYIRQAVSYQLELDGIQADPEDADG